MSATSAILRSRHKRRARIRMSSAQQAMFGVLLVAHALAHSIAGIWASALFSTWSIVPLWDTATVGFLAAGLGAMGVKYFRKAWREITVLAAFSSTMLLFAAPASVFMTGFALNLAIGTLASYSSSPRHYPNSDPQSRSWARSIGRGLAVILTLYVAGVIAVRPLTTRWGTTRSDIAAILPGDELSVGPQYSIEHAITINAPLGAVWPWLIQIGQNRAGFYSYSMLENAVGAQVTNSNRVVPEWQSLRAGDLIRAVPPTWMRGKFGTQIGWRVTQVIPQRAIVLEGWGAFVLTPINSGTRMIVRTRAPLRLRVADVVLSPLSVFVFEPAHFLMQRRMLIGIRERAERATRSKGN